ncbi:hypothetical protein Tco_0625970 [Tanacetum coccineum]|uniref:Uncharacterized protein n=1 Tax=Tanacetum coccineum TaxID=301880 RepID=A0ABQ4WIB8_9ASTR
MNRNNNRRYKLLEVELHEAVVLVTSRNLTDPELVVLRSANGRDISIGFSLMFGPIKHMKVPSRRGDHRLKWRCGSNYGDSINFIFGISILHTGGIKSLEQGNIGSLLRSVNVHCDRELMVEEDHHWKKKIIRISYVSSESMISLPLCSVRFFHSLENHRSHIIDLRSKNHQLIPDKEVLEVIVFIPAGKRIREKFIDELLNYHSLHPREHTRKQEILFVLDAVVTLGDWVALAAFVLHQL